MCDVAMDDVRAATTPSRPENPVSIQVKGPGDNLQGIADGTRSTGG